MVGRLRCIRDHILFVMGTDPLDSGTVEWEILEAIMQWFVYRPRRVRGGRVLGLLSYFVLLL